MTDSVGTRSAPMRLVTDLLWRLQCRLNRRLRGSPELGSPEPAQFLPCGASRDPRAGELPAERPALCVVITTHARVAPCASLLEQLAVTLADAGLSERAFVLVLDDPSQDDYAEVLALLARLFAGRFAFLRASRRLGKPGRPSGYQTAFDVVRALSPGYTLFLEDDAVLGPTFLRDALARWAEIDDARKAVLYLCRFDDDEPNGRWVRFARRVVPPGRVQQTQWFDLHAFLVTHRFFELLDYRLFQPWPSRWQGEPSRSSGVSEQFTLRLFGRGNVYQVCETLALHGALPSVLNSEARARRALNNHPGSSELRQADASPASVERISAARALNLLALALLVCFSGLPAAFGREASFLAELALVVLGALLVLRVAHRWLGSARQRAVWRLLLVLIASIGFGQVVRSKKLFPLMPYTMYGRAPEAPAKFYQFEAQRRSGARERFRPSRVIATLGRARIVKGLSRELDRMAEGEGEGALRARERVSGMLAALAAYDDRAHASDPWVRIDVIAVELPAPYTPSAAERRTVLTLPLTVVR